MAKKKKSPKPLEVSQSRNKVSGMFNFLEKLMVFCTLKERSVPEESGVRFGVGVPRNDLSFCILFKTDQKPDFLFQQQNVARPDYLCLYINSEDIICTIIEMKGKDEGELTHGVEQIRALKNRLVQEIRVHLPSRFLGKIKLQGILMAPHNAQIPNKALLREQANGFVITPLRYTHKADLYKYISTVNKLSGIGKPAVYDRTSARDRDFGFVETLLVERTLDNRIQDEFYNDNFEPARNREGVYLNCILSNKNEYFVLMATTQSKIIAKRENSEGYSKTLMEELSALGYQDVFRLKSIDD